MDYLQGTHNFVCTNVVVSETWLKIEKRMDTYTSFYGTQEVEDGPITWTVQKTIDVPNIHAAGEYNVGLAVASQRYIAQEVVFSNYEVDSYYFPSAAPSVSAAPTMYVPGEDIGTNSVGSASTTNSVDYAVSGAGGDIWGSTDHFHYVPFAKNHANVKAEILVEDFAPVVHQWQKGGIMMRESMATGSRHYSIYLTGSNGISNQWRANTNGGSSHVTNSNLKTKPVYLQVTKIGNQFSTAYKYEAAGEWIAHSGPTTIEFGAEGETFYVGIAVTSQNTGVAATLTTKGFVITDLPIEEEPTTPTRKLRG